MASGRKWHEIDLVKLYNNTSHREWNHLLFIHEKNEDILSLEKLYYGVQSGMDRVVKNKMNNDKFTNWFIRLSRSIEITVKNIYRKKFPSRLDDPLKAKSLMTLDFSEYKKELVKKRQRDQDYEAWLTKVRF